MSEPALDKLNLFDVATLVSPYDAYDRLRNESPVHFIPEMNMHYVTRYDLVRQALKDTETYSSRFDEFIGAAAASGVGAAPPEIAEQLAAVQAQMIEQPPTMLTLDEPEHTGYRSLVSQLFTGSQVKRSQDQVVSVVEEYADSFVADAGDQPVDYMAGFAFPVPLRIIGDRLGIPEEDREAFSVGATAAAATLRMQPLTPEQMLERAQTALALQQLLVRLIEARRAEPTEDMISILANSTLEQAGRSLTHGECLSILQQFLVAGHETTTSTFGWGMLALCQHPELQDALRGDARAVKTFVEEVLRVESPVQGLPRLVTRDTELGGCPISAGQFVMLRFGAANRDERQFTCPAEVDIHREKAGMQLAFGAGVHHCIGAPLARQELNLGFPALLDRMQRIRLSEAHGIPDAEPSFILRNLPELFIEFERR